MKKQICILTKSYKHGGYCVAGVDIETKEWIRLVNSDNPNADEIREEQMFLNGRKIDCLDVLEYDFIKSIPNSCQTENWLLNKTISPKFIKSISLEELADIIKLEKEEFFICNKSNLLTPSEILGVARSLYVFNVKNLEIIAAAHQNFDVIRYKYKCKFTYKNRTYSNISLTDPIYRDVDRNEEVIENALIIASLPCVPYEDGSFYKFVAKIIPVSEEIVKLIEIKSKHDEDIFSDYEILEYILNSINPFTKNMIIGIDMFLRERLKKIADKIRKTTGNKLDNPGKEEKTVNIKGWDVYIDDNGEVLTDMGLLKRLQKVRIKIGDEKNTPYYIIATNKVLVRLATEKPTTREEFINIKGIRDRWFDNNGQAFLQEIKDYLENQ